MQFCLMTMIAVVLGAGPIHAAPQAVIQPTIWNEDWVTYQRQWTVHFEQLLKALQGNRYDDAVEKTDRLVKVLANVNFLAQRTYDTRQYDTDQAVKRLLRVGARDAMERANFKSKEDQDLMMLSLAHLVARANQGRALKKATTPDVRIEQATRSGQNLLSGAVGAVLGGAPAVWLFTHFPHLHHRIFHTVDASGTVLTAALLGALIALYFKHWSIPLKGMDANLNIVAPALEDCRKNLMN